MPIVENDELRECGRLLQDYRKKAGVTQEWLAEKAKVSVATIKRYESGESEIPMLKLFSICSALKINAYWLMPYTYEKELYLSPKDLDLHETQIKLRRLDRRLGKSLVAGFNATIDTLITESEKP
ncbi:MAG: helix-turn-helix domain-containing protein [Oscillospiraceae bacterium]|nr:helix-turn-helix domain-containing protein [Oscillospiraceae bacterium]